MRNVFLITLIYLSCYSIEHFRELDFITPVSEWEAKLTKEGEYEVKEVMKANVLYMGHILGL